MQNQPFQADSFPKHIEIRIYKTQQKSTKSPFQNNNFKIWNNKIIESS